MAILTDLIDWKILMCDSLFKNKLFSYIYPSVLFLLAAVIILLNVEIEGAVLFVFIISAVLVVSSRLTDAMLPAMLLSVFVTRCYDSADAFLAVAWAAVPPVFSVIFHFVKYRKPIRIGKSFYGLCAIAVAITLGGLGTISAADYFYPTSLFYVFGLGIGLVLFYLLVKSQLTSEAPFEIMKIMYITGLLACFCVIRFYIERWDVFCDINKFIFIRSSNNLATFLMLAMPFPLYYAQKRHVDILCMILMYVCTVFTGSRGGIFMGTVEFVILAFVYVLSMRRKAVKFALCVLLVVAIVIGAFVVMPHILELCGANISSDDDDGFDLSELIDIIKKVCSDDDRESLLERMIKDFKSNPVFGVGIGYKGNSDIYNPVKGAMNWYHMWFAQVIGGLGLVGIAAYAYQGIGRIIVFVKNRKRENLIFFLSYIGLFLMSQVNPGEFCPVPYAILAVTYFIMMEEGRRETADVPFLKFKDKKSLSVQAAK